MEECWSIFEQQLLKISLELNAQVGSFVLMSNHFHMILWTPMGNIDQVMHRLLCAVSKKMNTHSQRINHVFGDRYKWNLIQNQSYLSTVYKYVYRNPAKANLVKNVEDYQFSTLKNIVRNKPSGFPLFEQNFELGDLAFWDMTKRVQWLNEPYNEKQNEVIQKGLKRAIFGFPKHRTYKKIVESMVPKGDRHLLELYKLAHG
jgi:putative transposase